MALYRFQVKELMGALTRNIELAFNRFLGARMQPIYDGQWGAQTSWGYRIRDTAYFLMGDGTPLVCGLDHIPRGKTMPRQLDPSLTEAQEAWLELYETHMQQWPRIQRAIGSMVLKCDSIQDFRDMFPEHVIQPILEHQYLQVTDANGVTSPMARSRPDALNSKTWPPLVTKLYEGVSDSVNTYIGFKFLQ